MVDGMIRFMKSSDEFTGPLNLGNPEEVTVLQLAEKILELTNSRSGISFKALPEDDPQKRQPDITLARERLSWTPKIPLEEGLLKTITYFDDLLGSGYEQNGLSHERTHRQGVLFGK